MTLFGRQRGERIRAVAGGLVMTKPPSNGALNAKIYVLNPKIHVRDAKLYVLDAKLYVLDAKLHVLDAKLHVLDAKLYVRDAKLHVRDAKLYVWDAKIGILDAKQDILEPFITQKNPSCFLKVQKGLFLNNWCLNIKRPVYRLRRLRYLFQLIC